MNEPGFTGRQIAITGATGFVGLQVTQQLIARGARVTALVRPTSKIERLQTLGVNCVIASLNDASSIDAAMKGCDLAIHTAGAVDFGEDWNHLRSINVDGTQAVMEGARQAGVRRVVHVSSIVAVGASQRAEILDETATWNLGPFHVPYATTKREGEEAALRANSNSFEVVVVNPGCVIGPDDFSASEFGSLCRRFWKGKVPISFTGGNNFVDVRDVASGILGAAMRGRPGERYLLTGENHRFSSFFSSLAAVSHRTHPRVTLPAWLAPPIAKLATSIEARRKRRKPVLSISQARLLGLYFFFDAGKAKRELGFAVRPFSDTVLDTYRYWMEPNGSSRAAAA
ncbi:MAG: NAD-dependent epimerase/dehydratase family protein [Gemmataceae bacterium]